MSGTTSDEAVRGAGTGGIAYGQHLTIAVSVKDFASAVEWSAWA